MAKKPSDPPKGYVPTPNDDVIDYRQTVSRVKLPDQTVYQNLEGYDVEIRFKKRPSKGGQRGRPKSEKAEAKPKGKGKGKGKGKKETPKAEVKAEAKAEAVKEEAVAAAPKGETTVVEIEVTKAQEKLIAKLNTIKGYGKASKAFKGVMVQFNELKDTTARSKLLRDTIKAASG